MSCHPLTEYDTPGAQIAEVAISVGLIELVSPRRAGLEQRGERIVMIVGAQAPHFGQLELLPRGRV